MERNKVTNKILRYTVSGTLFGCLFPLAAFLLQKYLPGRPVSLFILMCMVPLVLGFFAYLFGKKEKELILKYKDLKEEAESRANAIRGLMDVSGLGILSFGNDLTVDSEYSRECNDIFGGPVAGKLIPELLFINPTIRDDFREGMELFFAGKSKSQVIFDLTEKETVINGQFYSLDFREVSKDSILCVLTNVTSERRLEEKIQHEIEERKILLRAVSHKNYFGSFIKEAAMIFDHINAFDAKTNKSKKELEELQRELHTFKGNAGFFGFTNTEEVALDFEYYIADMITLGEDIEFSEITQDLKKVYFNELQVIKKTLGTQWIAETDSVLVPREEYLKIERYIKIKLSADKTFCNLVERFRKVPFNHLFARFPAIAERLADNLGKKLNPLVITGGDFLVLPEKYESLVNTFVHFIRNMVDHGIETPTEREIQQKSRAGTIKIDIQSFPEGIAIRFSDDGQGISLHTLKEKAVEMKLISPDSDPVEKELLDFLFLQSFSTSESVSHVSGWGVGLAAVKEAVEFYQGRISVSTKLNEGTTFEIILPVK